MMPRNFNMNDVKVFTSDGKELGYVYTNIADVKLEDGFKSNHNPVDFSFKREATIEMKNAELNMKGLINGFYGYKVVENPYLTTRQLFRVKTHKNNRIDKKYLKKYGWKSISVPDRRAFLIQKERMIIVHPSIADELSKALLFGSMEGFEIVNG